MLADDQKTNWVNLKTAFQEWFTLGPQNCLLSQQLAARKQLSTEPRNQYITDIMSLCIRLKLSDVQSMRYFIRNSPPEGTLMAKLSCPSAVNDENEQEIINVHIQEDIIAQEISQLNENIDASEHTKLIDNTAVPIQVHKPGTSTDDMNPNLQVFCTSTDALPGVQDAPHCCDESTALHAKIVNENNTNNEVDIPIYNDPAQNRHG